MTKDERRRTKDERRATDDGGRGTKGAGLSDLWVLEALRHELQRHEFRRVE